MSITDKSAEADFFCGIFAAIYTFYPENLHISEKSCIFARKFAPL